MKKFKRRKYPNLNKRTITVLIVILILFFVMFYISKVNADPDYAVVSGYAWEDTDKDGIKDPSELIIPDIEVYLCNEAGEVLQNSAGELVKTKTDSNGYYKFEANLGPQYDKYKIKFRYDGLQYKMTEIMKKTTSYDIDGFVNKLDVIWNVPKTSIGRELRFQARLNQFNVFNKQEITLQYDTAGIYKNNTSVGETNIVKADMLQIGTLNLSGHKKIFFIYMDNTNPPAKDGLVTKLEEIQNTIDDNDYLIIIYFSEDYADLTYKSRIQTLASRLDDADARVKVIANEEEFEAAVKLYLNASNANDDIEIPFGDEDATKRNYLENTYIYLSASDRHTAYQQGETYITADSYALDTDGRMVEVSIGLERLTIPEDQRGGSDQDAGATGDKLVQGTIKWSDGTVITNTPIKVELFKKVYEQAEYDARVAAGAYGEINNNPAESHYGMVLVGDKTKNYVVQDNGSYSLAYTENYSEYMVRFTYGHNRATQEQDINGEKCLVPAGAVPVSVGTNNGQNNATENEDRRFAINQYFESDEDGDGIFGVNNYQTRLNALDMNKLIEKTQMTATTDWFYIQWTEDDPDTDDNDPTTTEDNEYRPPAIRYANLFLQRRDKVDFKVTSNVEAVKVTLSDGTIHTEMYPNTHSVNLSLDPVYLQIDDEIMHGATMEVQYVITIKNTGDLPITSFRFMNYLDHQYDQLQYAEEATMLTENKKNKDYGWVYQKDFEIQDTSDHNFQNQMMKDRTYLEYKHTETVDTGHTVTLRLIASTTLRKNGQEQGYSNSSELINYTTGSGRVRENTSTAVSIIGNLNPDPAETDLTISQKSQNTENDQDYAQRIIITPPTGTAE